LIRKQRKSKKINRQLELRKNYHKKLIKKGKKYSRSLEIKNKLLFKKENNRLGMI
jgi:hypothetical protein